VIEDKLIFSTKLKESVLTRNISLGSMDHLPARIKDNQKDYLSKFLLFYNKNIFSSKLEILNPKEIFLFKTPELPQFQKGELILLILPEGKERFIFQTRVEEVTEEGYKLKILDPRYDKRYILKVDVPVFISLLSQRLLFDFFNKNYYFVRETNFFDSKSFTEIQEIHFYDLILNENNKIEPEFHKLIEKNLFNGEACKF